MAVKTNAQFDALAMEVPAPFVNQFQVLVAGSNVRVAFAEGFSGHPTNYRSAVVMSADDARELAMAILASLPPTQTALTGLQGLLSNKFGVLAPGRGLAGGILSTPTKTLLSPDED